MARPGFDSPVGAKPTNNKAMKEPIEHKVAMTILEEHIGEIALDGETYTIPAPTTATIIAASALISTLPDFDLTVPDDMLPAEVLKNGRHGITLAKIAATMMLGQKRIKEHRTVKVQTGTNRRWSWRRFRVVEKPTTECVAEFDYLTQKILDNCTTAHLREITFALIKEGGLDDFFIITTSLHARNQLAPTREVEEATAYGRS